MFIALKTRTLMWKTVSVFTALTLVVPVNVFLFAPQVARADTIELFSDNFNRGSNSDVVGGDWDEALNEWDIADGEDDNDGPHANKEQIRSQNNPGHGRYARLHGENTNNLEHADHPKAAITHEIPDGGDSDALLTFRWRGDGAAAVAAKFQVILGGPDDAPLVEYSIKANTDWLDFGDEPIVLPDGVCGGGSLLTFRSTANNNSVTVDIDDVRVTCEEEAAPPPITTVTVIKHVVGGDAEAPDFTMLVDGSNVSPAFFPGSEGGTVVALDPGPFAVSETGPGGYVASYVGNCAGFISEGQAFECTVTNTFVPQPGGTITGYKFNDLDGDGVWHQPNGQLNEPGIEDWTVALGRVTGEPDPESGRIPIEIIAMDLTGGAGQFTLSGVSPGHYALLEEQRPGWDTTSPPQYPVDSFFDIEYRIENVPPLVENSFFDVFVELDGSVQFFSGAPFAQVPVELPLFGNWEPPVRENRVHAFKYFDADQNGEYDNGDYPLERWGICLSGDGDMNPEDECQLTDAGGFVWWDVSPNSEWELWEEFPDDQGGWMQTAPPGGTYEIEADEDGQVTYWFFVEDEGWMRVEGAEFGNWLDGDREPPQSFFDITYDHRVIDTEMVALDLRGTSNDNQGIGGTDTSRVELRVHEIGQDGSFTPDSFFDVFTEIDLPGLLDAHGFFDVFTELSYPAQSFFDVFTELNCDTVIERRNAEGGTIPIEIIQMELQSVDPLTVQWGHNWELPGPGVYCFEARATDDAGNVEQTAVAGPVAYVPVPQIADEETVATGGLTSMIIEWITDHLATSRVIYDTVSHALLGDGPCPDPLNALNCYGYAFSAPESDIGTEEDPMVLEHAVTLEGLTPGTTYYYRVVSHGSPENVGPQGSFTPPLPPPGGGGGGGSQSTPPPPPPPPASPASPPPPSENSGQSSTPQPPSPPEGQVLGFAELPETGSAKTASDNSIVWMLLGMIALGMESWRRLHAVNRPVFRIVKVEK